MNITPLISPRIEDPLVKKERTTIFAAAALLFATALMGVATQANGSSPNAVGTTPQQTATASPSPGPT
jgi:hypothetical protein